MLWGVFLVNEIERRVCACLERGVLLVVGNHRRHHEVRRTYLKLSRITVRFIILPCISSSSKLFELNMTKMLL